MHADDADDADASCDVVVTIANPHLWPNSETMIMMTHTRGADDVARRSHRLRPRVDRDERVDKHQ